VWHLGLVKHTQQRPMGMVKAKDRNAKAFAPSHGSGLGNCALDFVYSTVPFRIRHWSTEFNKSHTEITMIFLIGVC
jgi:hypothetical protein